MASRDFSKPPPDVSPGDLFALLVQPSPSVPLEQRLAGAEEVSLLVRPVAPLELGAALRAAEGLPAPELRRATYARQILARCLWTPEGKAFGSVEEVGVLDLPELTSLALEALDALATIGPTYARSDWQAWQETLSKGARESANASTAIALAGCADYGHGAVVFRPDRFWGVAVSQLLDGHWMAYRAARKAWVDDQAPAPRSVAEALRQAQQRRA